MSVNVIKQIHIREDILLSEVKTFQTVFPNSYVFAVRSPKGLDSQNIILVGFKSKRKINFSDPRYARLRSLSM